MTISAMTAKATRKEVVTKEWEEQKVQVGQRKVEQKQEEACTEASKLMWQIQVEKKANQEWEWERVRKTIVRARGLQARG